MGLPDEFHDAQPDLLKETCQPQAKEFFMAADLNLYYDAQHLIAQTGFWSSESPLAPLKQMLFSATLCRKSK
jgi:hypothetical protein